MKKLLSLLVLLVLACSLALPAMASGTGASPEEIARYTAEIPVAAPQRGASAEAKALYNTKGVAGAAGMPALAKDTLGPVAGAQFAAVAAASAQGGGNIAEVLQELVDSGMTVADAIQLVLTSYYTDFDPETGLTGYVYPHDIFYTLVSQATASICQHTRTGNVIPMWDVEMGSGYKKGSSGWHDGEAGWKPDFYIWYTLVDENGVVLAESEHILLPHPELESN